MLAVYIRDLTLVQRHIIIYSYRYKTCSEVCEHVITEISANDKKKIPVHYIETHHQVFPKDEISLR